MPKLLIPFETKNSEKTPADLRPRVTALWPMSHPLYPLVFFLAETSLMFAFSIGIAMAFPR